MLRPKASPGTVVLVPGCTGLLQRDYQQRLLELSDVIQQQQQQEQEAAAMEASSEEVDAMSEDAAALQSPDGSVGGHR